MLSEQVKHAHALLRERNTLQQRLDEIDYALVGIEDQGFDLYAWPGGYSLLYWTECGDVLCGECAPRWVDEVFAVECAANYDEHMVCSHCGEILVDGIPEPDEVLD